MTKGLSKPSSNWANAQVETRRNSNPELGPATGSV
jgi:hypothetical protein